VRQADRVSGLAREAALATVNAEPDFRARWCGHYIVLTVDKHIQFLSVG
jgi:hypothetical protein